MFEGPLFLLWDYITGEPTAQDGLFLVVRLFSVAAIIFVLFPIHECAHAWAAYKLGDHTAKNEGRLTLNPFAHIAPLGALIMLVLPIGWAKPVPVDSRNATRKVTQRGFIALTAAAGPASNILLSLVLIIAAKICGMGGSDFLNIFAVALYMTAQISVFLAVFNLIPLPPLDGSKILYFFLSARQIHAFERHSHIVRMALLISLIFFRERNPILWLIGTVSRYIMLFLDTITFFLR